MNIDLETRALATTAWAKGERGNWPVIFPSNRTFDPDELHKAMVSFVSSVHEALLNTPHQRYLEAARRKKLRVIDLDSQGFSGKDIAKITGISTSRVSQYLVPIHRRV